MRWEKAHWVVGNRKFFNKLSAIAESERLNIPVEFHLFEDVFDRMNWAVEPPETWEELLRQRALQIRQRYQYVRLWYSGGADSHTILLTFLKNKIPLDEILMIRRSPINRFDIGVANCEINDAAIPFLKMHENELRGTKITICDLGREVFEKAFVPDDNWLYKINNLSFLPDNAAVFSQNIEGVLDRSYSYQTYCDIDGYEKPKLTKRGGKYYSYFWDGAFQRGIGINDHQIQFYVSPEFPQLHLKQCYLAMHFIEKNYPGEESVEEFFDASSARYTEMTASCRYPLTFDVSSLRLGKSKSIYSPKTLELLEQAKRDLPHLYEAYIGNLRAENNLFAYRYNQNDIAYELKGIRTKEYCLGSGNG